MSILQKLLIPSGFALDPRRTLAARRDFDLERGFDRYAAFCRDRMSPPVPSAEPEDDLGTQGVELLPVLSEARAAEVLAALLATSSGVQPSDKGIDYSETLAFDRADAFLPLFEEMLAGRVDEKLRRHFGAEYLVYSYAVIRTLPKSEERRSFLWHCDRGPQRFLKILMYLNGSDHHGGNTEFLDRDTTQQFERLGYVFGPNKRRSADLSPLARRHGITYAPRLWPIKGGEAILFEPSGVLHRGIMPKRGERYVLLIMLMPSPMPWREAFDVTARTRFCETNAGAWPAHARDLLSLLGVDPAAAQLHCSQLTAAQSSSNLSL